MASDAANDPDATSTREALVTAAVDAFSRSGYNGVTLRDIERRAGVNRGLATYHFGSKHALWERAIDTLMGAFRGELTRHDGALALVSVPERARVLLKLYVHFVAAHPAFFRLLILEDEDHSEREQILVDRHLRPLLEEFRRLAGIGPPAPDQAAIDHFVFAGSASMIFAASAQCRYLFGFDPSDPGFVELFADRIAAAGYGRQVAPLSPGG